MQRLKEELFKIVYEYSKEENLVDKDFIEEVLDLCITTFKIEDYVLDRNIGENNIDRQDVPAGYWIDSRQIVIDIDRVKNHGIHRIMEEKKLGISSNPFLDYFKMNSNSMYGIVHELTHACQYKKCLEEDNDLETEILKLNLDRNLVVLKRKQITPNEAFYYKALDKHFLGGPYYEACPSERMADIRGLEFERDISKLLYEKKKYDIRDYAELRLLNGKINAYKDCSPTTFITLVNEVLKGQYGIPHKYNDMEEIENMYRILANKYKLSFDERIWLGLPITEHEKQKVLQKTKELQNILLRKD